MNDSEWMNQKTSQTYLGHWLSPLACCLFYKSDISLPLKGNDKNIPQSKGIAGDKTRVLPSKTYSRVCVCVCVCVCVSVCLSVCLKGTYKQDVQKINEIIPGTDNPVRRVPWTWDKKWVSNKYPNVFLSIVWPPAPGINPSTPQRRNPCCYPEGCHRLVAEGVLLEPELLKKTSLEASIQEGLVASGLLRDAMVMNGILPFSFRKRFFF